MAGKSAFSKPVIRVISNQLVIQLLGKNGLNLCGIDLVTDYRSIRTWFLGLLGSACCSLLPAEVVPIASQWSAASTEDSAGAPAEFS
jgi:hypothetical protein